MIKLGEFFVLLCKTSYHDTLDLHLTIVSKHQCRQTSTQPTQVNLMPYAPTVPTIAMPCQHDQKYNFFPKKYEILKYSDVHINYDGLPYHLYLSFM